MRCFGLLVASFLNLFSSISSVCTLRRDENGVVEHQA